jgi:hypothetical protein
MADTPSALMPATKRRLEVGFILVCIGSLPFIVS